MRFAIAFGSFVVACAPSTSPGVASISRATSNATGPPDAHADVPPAHANLLEPTLHDGTPDVCSDTAAHLPAPRGHCEPPFLTVSWRIETAPLEQCQVPPIPLRLAETTSAFFVARSRSAESVEGEALVRRPREQREDTLYWVESGPERMFVARKGGELVPPGVPETNHLRAILTPWIAWPNAPRVLATGTEATELASAVRAIADVPLRDAPAPFVAVVRFRESAREPWGDALVFDVKLSAMTTARGTYYAESTEVRGKGDLVLRASDGALAALHLRGAVSDTEVLVHEPLDGSGLTRERKTCTRGEMTFDAEWDCSQCLWRD
jgi:hypothetical protein